MPRNLIPAIVGAFVGNLIFDQFIAKTDPGGPGFVMVEPGIGADDFVRAASVVIVGAWVKRMLPG